MVILYQGDGFTGNIIATISLPISLEKKGLKMA
jgi:hypothetical protein